MNVSFPVIELLDRLAIAEIKYEKTQSNQAELDYYKQQVNRLNFSAVQDEFQTLKQIHRDIWNLEKELKSGHEDQLPLEEIGRRAIVIRNMNNRRINIKNQMAEILDCSVREIKHDHLSE